MAELSLATSIITVVDFSVKVLARLDEFRSAVSDVPQSLRHIHTNLPLICKSLQQTKEAVDSGNISVDVQKALVSVVDGCHQQTEAINELLKKSLPSENDSSWRRGRKALRSLLDENKIEQILKALTSYMQTLTFYHTTSTSIEDAKVQCKYKDVYNWLFTTDPSTTHEKALKQHLKGTGRWFIEGNLFSKWKINAASLLWLHGIPGCGKTILCSVIVDNLFKAFSGDPGTAVLYFYFRFDNPESQKCQALVRSLLCQLADRIPLYLEPLEQLYISCGSGMRQPTTDALVGVLNTMIARCPRVYIVIDALDECNDSDKLLEAFQRIMDDTHENLHLLIASREKRDIETVVNTYIKQENSVPLETSYVDPDIQFFIKERLLYDRKLQRLREDLSVKEIVTNDLSHKAKGMFRWAACQLDALGKCRSKRELLTALKSLPETLDETYERILCDIKEKDVPIARNVLTWLVFSKKTLSMNSITMVAAFDDAGKFDLESRLWDPHVIQEICQSLVDTKKEHVSWDGSPYITLAHYSVEEYLLSQRILLGQCSRFALNPKRCHDFIARCYLHSMLYFNPYADRELPPEWGSRLYRSHEWLYHYKNSLPVSESLLELTMRLITDENMFKLWLEYLNQSSSSTPLYMMSQFGLDDIVQALIVERKTPTSRDFGKDIDAKCGVLGSAIAAAVKSNNLSTVEILLDNGADVNVTVSQFPGNIPSESRYIYELFADRSLVYIATKSGHESVSKLLLDRGATNYQDAFCGAAQSGLETILERVMDKVTNVNCVQQNHVSHLFDHSLTAVKFSVKHGADVNIHSYDHGFTPLMNAMTHSRNIATVKFLLESGADPNLASINIVGTGALYSLPLTLAIQDREIEMVRLLLDFGAQIHKIDESADKSALDLAIIMGNQYLVEMLIGYETNSIVHGDRRTLAIPNR